MPFPLSPTSRGARLLAVGVCALALAHVSSLAKEEETEAVRPARPDTVWIIAADSQPAATKLADALRPALSGFGLSEREMTARQWIQQLPDRSGPGDIVIVLPGVIWPSDCGAKLESYLRQGNHLLNLSPSAFSSLPSPIILETLSPPYKLSPTTARRLRLPDNQRLDFAADTAVTTPLPRQRGLGCDLVRPARFIPIAEAVDQEGRSRGSAAHLYLNTTTNYAGAVWGGLGLSPATIDDTLPETVRLIALMADRIRHGIFLADAGPEHFAYPAEESVLTGADLVNLSGEPQTVLVSLTVTRDGREMQDWSASVSLPARTLAKPLHVGPPPLKLAPGQYQVTVRIHAGEMLVDEISCPVQVIEFGPVPTREVVVTSGGDFILDGKPWHPLGMNYWPHLSVALEPKDFSRLWLSPEQYDPELVERDLQLAEQLGLNVLSIQYSDLGQARPLMDFLARANRHRLKVNIYSPAFEPLRQNLAMAQSLILGAHLNESTALFAYDVCWEGHLGDYNARSASNPRWQTWVTDRYGSVAAAEKDWQYVPPRVADTLTGPTDDQLMNDGTWRVFVAAYRRFWDDEISRSYREVRKAIQAVDPNHLIGARSGYGGNGTPMYANMMPFDLASGARYLDFISPEGYALSGDQKAFLRGGLTTAYARLVSGGKPVFWAEYGVPVRWQVEPQHYRPAEKAEELEPQRAYFHNMLWFVRETGASGCSGWWWPSGYRVDEKSDFGIVNPDGTLRPAANELSRFARAYSESWQHSPTDTLLDLDRDKYVNGYAGLYTAMADQYAQAWLDGHPAGARTAGTGTTSADTPPIAVGNVPWNGHNPPKFLNSEFTQVELRDRNGWRRIGNGELVEIPAEIARFRVRVANTAEASWLTPGESPTGGGVLLEVRDNHGRAACHPLPNAVAFLGDATFPEFDVRVDPDRPTAVVLCLVAEKRTPFGERFRVELKARPDNHAGDGSR